MGAWATRVALGFIVGVALITRVALVLPYVHADYFLGISPVFLAWGYNLAAFGRWDLVENNLAPALGQASLERGWLVSPAEMISDGFVPEPVGPGVYNYEQPGEGVLLGLVWSIVRDYHLIWPLLAQAALDSLACLLAYLLGKRIWGTFGGLLAALGYALFLCQAVLTAYPMYNVWAGPFLLALILLGTLAVPGSVGRTLLQGGAVGAVAGLATLFMPAFILSAVPIGAAKLASMGWRKTAIWTLAALVMTFVILTPWSLRNLRINNTFQPTASAFWYNVYYGMGEAANNPYGWTTSDAQAVAQVRDTLGYVTWHTPESESVFRPLVIDGLRKYPLYYTQIIGLRSLGVVLLANWPADASNTALYAINCYQAVRDNRSLPLGACDADAVNHDRFLGRTISWLENVWDWNHPLAEGLPSIAGYRTDSIVLGIFGLSVVGLVIGFRQHRGSTLALMLLLAYTILMYAIFHIESRYVAGVQSLLVIAGCAGLGWSICQAAEQLLRLPHTIFALVWQDLRNLHTQRQPRT